MKVAAIKKFGKYRPGDEFVCVRRLSLWLRKRRPKNPLSK
jgi:hypothetical protein